MKYPPEKLEEARKLKSFIEELCLQLPTEFIVIGGWAVYGYNTQNLTFDGDAMISAQAHGYLRDIYNVTANPRMKKQQFVGPTNHDIDLYVEYQHGLRIPYDELKTFSKKRDNMTVACPEHLMILKLDAARNRRNTSKGQKDLEDIAALLSIPEEEFNNLNILARYMTGGDWEDLKKVSENQNLAERLNNGNQWQAKAFRENLQRKLVHLKQSPEQKLIPPNARLQKQKPPEDLPM